MSACPTTPEAYRDWLRSECQYAVVIPAGPGRWAGIHRLLFHWTMHIGDNFDFVGHRERYCYRTAEDAIAALADWAAREFQGEPQGWHKAPYTGRLRPDGDAAREYLEENWDQGSTAMVAGDAAGGIGDDPDGPPAAVVAEASA